MRLGSFLWCMCWIYAMSIYWHGHEFPCQMSLQEIAKGCDFYPAEMGDSAAPPHPFPASLFPPLPLPLLHFLTPLFSSRVLLSFSHGSSLSSPPPQHLSSLSFLSWVLLLFPTPPSSSPPPSPSPTTTPPPHTHTHTLYAGRLHRLISPHCDTFGAAACGLLIISTADSRHAPLFPTMQPLTHTHTHTYSKHIYALPREQATKAPLDSYPWPCRSPFTHWIRVRSSKRK